VRNDEPRTAMLLVDVIEGFFSESGSLYYPEVAEVVEPMRRLLRAARERRRLVVHAVERHHPGLKDFEHQRIPPHFMAGDPDARYFEDFRPSGEENEVEVVKRRYSAFYATELDLLLREQGVGTLVVAGVKTNVCIRATIQDAFAAGYHVILPREATNSNRPHLAAASLEDIDRYFGKVVSIEQALELL
jgi:maleamate amidohydrolase